LLPAGSQTYEPPEARASVPVAIGEAITPDSASCQKYVLPLEGRYTTRLKLVVLNISPDVPVTVIGKLPVGVESETFIIRVTEQSGLQLSVEKESVAPSGRPDTEKETA